MYVVCICVCVCVRVGVRVCRVRLSFSSLYARFSVSVTPFSVFLCLFLPLFLFLFFSVTPSNQTHHGPQVRAVIATKIYQFAKNLSLDTRHDAIVTQIIPPLEVCVH
jgi:hypothetical protein